MKIKLLPFLFCITIANAVFGQTAKFTADITEGCGKFVVTFTNLSEPAPGKTFANYVYEWVIKKYNADGTDTAFSQSTSDPLKIVFKTPGIHLCQMNMRLKVTGATVQSTSTDTVFVRPMPNAWFTVADTFTIKPLTYRFRSGKASTDTITYRYNWYIKSSDGSVVEDSIIHLKGNAGLRDIAIKEFTDTQDITIHKASLRVTDWFGCKDAYDTTFLVASKLVCPNVFTPNGDGTNDFFQVYTNGRNVYSLKVFTSNGTQIFVSESKNIEWDGVMSNGEKASPGTYFYVIQPVNPELPIKAEKGFFMLLREKK